MTYTKEIALTDLIMIDETDVSDCFRSFGISSEDEQVDVSGFNATGSDEFLAGKRTRSFSGEAFYTSELYTLLWPLHDGKEVFEVQWTPSGLEAGTRETYYGNCRLMVWPVEATRGDVRTATFTFPAADETGIQSTTST